MSKRPVQVLLEDMREATARIQEYTKGMSEDTFLKDRRTSDAVVRQGGKVTVTLGTGIWSANSPA